MSNSTYKLEKIYCEKAGKNVQIEKSFIKKMNIHQVQNGFDCKDACVKCGVVVENGRSRSYNWQNCPYYQ